MRELTPTEAVDWLQSGNGVIWNGGGYTLHSGGYFAFGTFPNCVRSGKPVSTVWDLPGGEQWYGLGIDDIFKRVGWFPGLVPMDHTLVSVGFNDAVRNRAALLNHELTVFAIANLYPLADWANPITSAKLCREILSRYDLRHMTGALMPFGVNATVADLREWRLGEWGNAGRFVNLNPITFKAAGQCVTNYSETQQLYWDVVAPVFNINSQNAIIVVGSDLLVGFTLKGQPIVADSERNLRVLTGVPDVD